MRNKCDAGDPSDEDSGAEGDAENEGNDAQITKVQSLQNIKMHYDISDYFSMARCLCDSLLVYCGMEEKLECLQPELKSSLLLQKLNRACSNAQTKAKSRKGIGDNGSVASVKDRAKTGDGGIGFNGSQGTDSDEYDNDQDEDLSFLALGLNIDSDEEEDEVGSDSDPSGDCCSDIEALMTKIKVRNVKGKSLHEMLGIELEKRKQRELELEKERLSVNERGEAVDEKRTAVGGEKRLTSSPQRASPPYWTSYRRAPC